MRMLLLALALLVSSDAYCGLAYPIAGVVTAFDTQYVTIRPSRDGAGRVRLIRKKLHPSLDATLIQKINQYVKCEVPASAMLPRPRRL